MERRLFSLYEKKHGRVIFDRVGISADLLAISMRVAF
jgi:hypothetical protein